MKSVEDVAAWKNKDGTVTLQCINHLWGNKNLDNLLFKLSKKYPKAGFDCIGTTIVISNVYAPDVLKDIKIENSSS